MARGGYRPGGGRPKGVGTATLLRAKIQDHFTDEEVQDLIQAAKQMAKKKPDVMRFLLEQIFGRAPQRLELSGQDGGPLLVKWLSPNDKDE